MHLVRFSLADPGPPTRPETEMIQDAIWAHTRGDSGVEHVTVTATTQAIELVIFLRSGIPDPDRYARLLIDYACQMSPALGRWRTITHQPFPYDEDTTI
jgi:hypothetical protein